MSTYLDYAQGTAPPWGDELFSALHDVLGILANTLAEGATQAVRARFIRYAPADAIDWIARERGLERGPAETLAQFRDRLEGAFEAYRYAGTEKAIKDQLAVVGFTDVAVYEAADWYPSSSEWWRFWLIIDEPHGIDEPSAFWDSSTWDGFSWDGVPPALLESIRRIVRKWKPAHAVMPFGVIAHGDATIWDHSFTWDSTSWDAGSVTTFGL